MLNHEKALTVAPKPQMGGYESNNPRVSGTVLSAARIAPGDVAKFGRGATAERSDRRG